MITWHQTCDRLRVDRTRLQEMLTDEEKTYKGNIVLNPSYWCVVLYRISHYFFCRGHRIVARIFWHINVMLTGADISPLSDIEGGLVIIHTASVVIFGKIGQNCTIHGWGGMGGGLKTKDIGAGPGLPILKDDVDVGPGAFVLGPFVVGNRVQIGPRCVVMRDVEDDTIISLKT